MARTESTSIQVHPRDEQAQIDLMQKFHWSLLSTQELKTVDSHLEKRGDAIYSVTKSENYVKLAFTRDQDLPNLQDIKRLESEYYSLSRPVYPKLFPGTIWVWLIGAAIYGIGAVGWCVYLFTYYKPKKAKADEIFSDLMKRRQEIMEELRKYD